MRVARWLFCVLIGIVASVAGPAWGADFRVTGRVVTAAFEGFGVNVSPVVYAGPNWPGVVNESNVGDLEGKVLELRPQLVRIFVLPAWWEKKGEQSEARSVERLCRLMDRAGAAVNLTLWGGKYDGADMGRRMAAVFAHLIRDEHLTCVRYATLQNEPNGFNMDKERYVALYRVFDAELRRLGVRDHLKIIGGDLVSTHQKEWFDMLTRRLSDVLDGYSVHEYSNYWDPGRMFQRVSEVPPIVASLPAAGRKPIYLMEFGVRGHREKKLDPGLYEDGRQVGEVPVVGNQLACYIIEAVNRGYVATCQWDLADVQYDRSVMQYGVIGAAKDGFPLKPGYSLLRMFTHSAGVGWEVVRVEGEAEMRSVAAMRSKEGGRWTVFAVNRGTEARPLSVEGLPHGMTFHVAVWNGDGKGQVEESAGVSADDQGAVTLSMPPMSVVALTGGAGK